MGRKFEKKEPKLIEDIVAESLDIVGMEVEEDKVKLLARLILSGIGQHYFFNPDDLIDMGFLRIQKSSEKDELFKVTIIRNKSSGVVNAETLWRYYRGDLQQERQFKEIMDTFLHELIDYSQTQEIEITKLTSQLQEKKRRTNHGISQNKF